MYEVRFFNNVPDTVEDGLAHIDEIGGPTVFNHFPWGWTNASNTPFKRWKRETYRGGSTDPFIVSWPAGIKARGEVRDHYAHIIDMVPTVLDALNIEPPVGHQGRDTVADRGGQLRAHLRRRQGALQAPHPVFRDDGPPLAVSRRLACGLPVAGDLVHRIRAQVR